MILINMPHSYICIREPVDYSGKGLCRIVQLLVSLIILLTVLLVPMIFHIPPSPFIRFFDLYIGGMPVKIVGLQYMHNNTIMLYSVIHRSSISSSMMLFLRLLHVEILKLMLAFSNREFMK